MSQLTVALKPGGKSVDSFSERYFILHSYLPKHQVLCDFILSTPWRHRPSSHDKNDPSHEIRMCLCLLWGDFNALTTRPSSHWYKEGGSHESVWPALVYLQNPVPIALRIMQFCMTHALVCSQFSTQTKSPTSVLTLNPQTSKPRTQLQSYLFLVKWRQEQMSLKQMSGQLWVSIIIQLCRE